MSVIRQEFSVPFHYDVIFTEGIFNFDNHQLKILLHKDLTKSSKRILCVFDEEMFKFHPDLFKKFKAYINHHCTHLTVISPPVILPGGETAKNSPDYVDEIAQAINDANMDRHSYVVAIGGGAVIDTAGYAAGIAHRGIRLIRVPTTVLAQNDAAVGVKNGVNAFGKKNFLGTFVPPFAVINDYNFLHTLDDRDWRSGISEALKVALLKDPSFFDFLEGNATALYNRDMAAMKKLIYRCAELHLQHISTSGDPFEMGSSRPLDFGHWAAHKLEQLTNYELRHGEAVAIGIGLDVTYSYIQKMITHDEWTRIMDFLKTSGFRLFIPELKTKLDQPGHNESVLSGLEEFREHLGGILTIMLLKGIGKGIEVHEIDYDIYIKSILMLEEFEYIESSPK